MLAGRGSGKGQCRGNRCYADAELQGIGEPLLAKVLFRLSQQLKTLGCGSLALALICVDLSMPGITSSFG